MKSLPDMSNAEILDLDVSELLSQDILLDLYDIDDIAERVRLTAILTAAAKNRGIEKEFKSVIKAFDEEDNRISGEYSNKTEYTTDFSFQEYELFCGRWIANDKGVRYENKNGEIVYASRIPLVPVALLENISTGIEKVKIAYMKNGKRSLICERSVTASASSIVKLADKGLEVTTENAKHLVRYISDCISLNLDTLPCYKAVSQLGWNEEGFAPYSKEIIFDGEKENGSLFRSVTNKGSFENWISVTETLRKSLPVRLMMSASFASVLIERVGALPFVFHLWGGTGTGKTVALMIAMSIWGNPAPGKMVRTMNMTQNSLLATAAFLNSIPFAGDELQTIKSKWDSYDQLIMRITEGIDRGRMSFDKNNEIKTWRCSFLFTGEEPCTKNSSGGGVKNRVIEMEVLKPLIVGYSGNEVCNILNANYGYAGLAFIEYISKIENLPEQFNELSAKIIETSDTTEKQAASMALILLADKLACECIFKNDTPLSFDDVSEYVTSSKEVDIAERAYEFVINHIAQNCNRFVADGNHGEFWGAIRNDEGYVLINAAVLKREMSANGFEFDSVKKKWSDKEYLIKNTAGRYSHYTAAYGVKANYIKLKYGDLPQTQEPAKDEDYIDIPFYEN